jgi:hypothetical protein
VPAEVALIEDAGRLRDLRDRGAALEHPSREPDPLDELEAVGRHSERRPEQPRQAVAADAGRPLELIVRDVGRELVVQQLARASERRGIPRADVPRGEYQPLTGRRTRIAPASTTPMKYSPAGPTA